MKYFPNQDYSLNEWDALRFYPQGKLYTQKGCTSRGTGLEMTVLAPANYLFLIQRGARRAFLISWRSRREIKKARWDYRFGQLQQVHVNFNVINVLG